MFWWFYWTGLAARCANLADSPRAVRDRRSPRDDLSPRPALGLRLATVDGIRVGRDRA